MENKLHTLGESLKAARVAHGFTQETLAETLEVNIKTIRNWEQNRAKPELNNLYALKDLYLCDMAYLFGETEKPTRDFPFLMEETGLSKRAIIELRTANKDNRSEIEKDFIDRQTSLKTRLIDAFICECDPIIEQIEKIITNNAICSYPGFLAHKDGTPEIINIAALHKAFKESFLKVYPPEEYPMLDGWDGLDEYTDARSDFVKALLDMSIDAKKEDILKSFKGIIDKLLSGETALEDK